LVEFRGLQMASAIVQACLVAAVPASLLAKFACGSVFSLGNFRNYFCVSRSGEYRPMYGSSLRLPAMLCHEMQAPSRETVGQDLPFGSPTSCHSSEHCVASGGAPGHPKQAGPPWRIPGLRWAHGALKGTSLPCALPSCQLQICRQDLDMQISQLQKLRELKALQISLSGLAA
jgi:hypothetical protein